MVTRRRQPRYREGGKSRLGCLLTVVVLAVAVYYGAQSGQVYYRYWRLLDEMRTQGRLAPGIDDDTIRRRLLRTIEELELPNDARKIQIRRKTRPNEIEIRTTYQDTLALPFVKYPITLTPETRQPL